MRPGSLYGRALAVLSLLATLTLPVTVLAQEESTGKVDAAGKTSAQDAGEPKVVKPFWPAWHKFVTDITESSPDHNPDPWEPMNRKIFEFNDVADRWVLKPVARGYQWVTPDPVESGVGNVFANLGTLTTIVNDLLQAKFLQAASDTGRFVVNTTVGLAGIFDVATPLGLKKHNEDFGQTLGYWGVGSGPYVVVPFFGSYTLRSGTGSLFETQSTDVIHYIDDVPTRNQAWGTRVIDRRASLLAAEKLITGDRYSFIRDAYLQQRQFLVNDGAVKDTFGEGEDWDWEDLESPGNGSGTQ